MNFKNTKNLIKENFFSNIPQDLVGGSTAAIVAIPIALAFGVASGLGPSAGLYGAIACGFFAAMAGGTPAQVSGPTGPLTVVVAAMYAANPGRPDIVFSAILIGGIFQIILAKIKAGHLIEYIPYPVISGFMSGIGIIIIIIQIPALLGQNSTGNVLADLSTLPGTIMNANIHALFTGIFTIVTVYLLPKLIKGIPAELTALIIFTSIASYFSLQIPTIHEIPNQLPIPRIPELNLFEIQKVLIAAMTIAILGSLDSLLTSLVADKATLTRPDSNQELIGQGIGNIAASLVGGLPGAGATMRTMVNIRAGGKSRLSGIVHAFVIIAIVLALGNLASKIPLAVLSGILIFVGLTIIDYRSLINIRKTPMKDVAVMLLVLFLTVFVDLMIAVLVGVCLACTLFVKEVSDAQLSEHGHLDTLEHLIEVAAHLHPETRKSIYTYTFNGPLFFGEVRNFHSAMKDVETAKYITLRFTNVPIIDQSGALALEEAEKIWQAKGAEILFIGIRPDIKKRLFDLGAIQSNDYCFRTLEEAVEYIDLQESATRCTD